MLVHIKLYKNHYIGPCEPLSSWEPVKQFNDIGHQESNTERTEREGGTGGHPTVNPGLPLILSGILSPFFGPRQDFFQRLWDLETTEQYRLGPPRQH